MATFRDRLRHLRTLAGYSQQDLADIMNVTKQTISQYERGVRKPDQDTLLELCDIFNVSTDYLLGKTDVTLRFVSPEEYQNSYYLDPDTAQIAQKILEDDKILFDVYQSSKRDQLMDYARKLAELEALEEGL